MFQRAVRATALLFVCLLPVSIAASCRVGAEVSIPKVGADRSEANKISDMKARVEHAQSLAEARERRWDRKMKAVSESICRGC